MTWPLTGNLTTSKSGPDPGLLLFPSVFSTHQAPFWVLKPFIMKGSEFPTVWLGDPRFCCHPCAEKAARPGDLGARGGERGGRPFRGLGARGAVPLASHCLGHSLQSPHHPAHLARCSQGWWGGRGCSCLHARSLTLHWPTGSSFNLQAKACPGASARWLSKGTLLW